MRLSAGQATAGLKKDLNIKHVFMRRLIWLSVNTLNIFKFFEYMYIYIYIYIYIILIYILLLRINLLTNVLPLNPEAPT